MLIQQIINGLTIGSTYALVAIGFTMVFGVLQLTNFVNGSFYMFGAYITLTFLTIFENNFILATLCSVVIMGLLGACMDKFALKPIRTRKAAPIAALISTVGIATCMDNLVQVIFGSATKPFPDALGLPSFNVGGVIISGLQILIFCVTIIIMVILFFLVNKTKVGQAMRATSQNASAARLMGINVDSIITLTFFIGSALAAVAGSLIGMYYQAIDTTLAMSVSMKTFAAAVLGGIGVLPGVVVGGLLIGLVETIVASYISSGYRDAIAFAILIIVLVFKPSGLMGKDQITKV